MFNYFNVYSENVPVCTQLMYNKTNNVTYNPYK